MRPPPSYVTSLSKSQFQDLPSHRPRPHPPTGAPGQPGIENPERKQRRPPAADAAARVLLSAPPRHPEPTQLAKDSQAPRSPRAEVAAIHATSPSPAGPAPVPTAVTAPGSDSSTCHRCPRRRPRTHLTAGSRSRSGSSL